MSFGLKNIYLTTAFFLWHFNGYPVRIILFKITYKGFGGRALPVANNLISLLFSFDFVKRRILHGANTIGQYADAIVETSCLKNLIYLNLSPYPGLGSNEKVGLMVYFLNPQWISSSV